MAKSTYKHKIHFSALTLGCCISLGTAACGGPTEPPVDNTTTENTTEDTAGSGGMTGQTTSGTTEGTSTCGSGVAPFQVVATGETNMTLVSDLQITEVQVAPSSLDITFDWSGLTADFYKHPITPADILQVTLLPWTVGTEAIEMGINVDDPELESLFTLPVIFDPQKTGTPVTSAKITDFVDVGLTAVPTETLLEYLDPAGNYTFTLILQVNKNVGVGSRMIQAFKPTAGATATAVSLTNTSSSLSATAVFGTPILVPSGDPNINFDWGKLTTRSFGGDFISEIFEIIVGKYQLDADLEAGILDIDYNYENFWRAPAPGVGTALNLSTLKDESGAAFPGIDSASQYLVGVVCPKCTNPSPWYLTKLEPCAP